jgi:hypothetical protein
MSPKRNPKAAGDFISPRAMLFGQIKHSVDDEGWRTVFDTYWKLLYSAAIQIRPL